MEKPVSVFVEAGFLPALFFFRFESGRYIRPDCFFRNHTVIKGDLIIENRKAVFAAEIKTGLSAGSGVAAAILSMAKDYPALKFNA